MTFARHVYPTSASSRRAVLQRRCRVWGHDWSDPIGLPAGRTCRECGLQEWLSNSPAATAAPRPQKGGEITMDNIFLTIDGITHEFAEVNGPTATAAAPRELTIKRPFVVYDVNGDRVDGYKYESRARRNNDARFAGVGYWLGNANTGDFQFVSA